MEYENTFAMMIEYLRKNWIALLSLIIAILSIFESHSANKLTKKVDDRTKPNFELEIQDSVYCKNGDKITYFFTVLVTNLSDSGNSIKDINLKVNYEEVDNKDVIFTLSKTNNSDTSVAVVPFFIEGRNSKLLKLKFEVPVEFKSGKKFLKYTLTAYDAFLSERFSTTTMINEVKNYGQATF